MTTLAFMADVHIGNHLRFGGPLACSQNTRCRLVLQTLKRALECALSETLECKLWVAGDLFDQHRPEAPVIEAVQGLLRGFNVTLMRGNHDQHSDEPGDHALAPLGYVDGIRVVDDVVTEHYEGVAVLAVPYRSGTTSKWLPEEVLARHEFGAKKRETRVMVLHAGIVQDSTPRFLQDAHDAITVQQLDALSQELKLDYVLAGNWHARVKIDRRLKHGLSRYLQIGALAPTGFNNPGTAQYGTVAILREPPLGGAYPHTLEIEEVPGPRFCKVSSERELRETADIAHDAGHQLFVEWTTEPDEAAAADQVVKELKAKRLLWDGDVLSVRAPAPTAEALRPGETAEVDDICARFIAAMPLPQGVERADVLAGVRRYLEAAKSV